MPSSLLAIHKTCPEDQRIQSDPKDRTFSSYQQLRRRQWTDMMGLPCSQTRMQLTALLMSLFVFKSADSTMGMKGWQRVTFSTALATVTFFMITFYQEARSIR